MISALRKFINKNDAEFPPTNGRINMPPGVQTLGKELQRKFARGVNYNMKVVIKGDNRVGKTSLLLRLKGYGFDGDYTPTESLNVTSIDWSYKTTDDIVKIDLWEAVDSASKRNVNFVDLKLENDNKSDLASNRPQDSAGTQIGTHPTTTPNSRVIITTTQLDAPNNNIASLNPIPESARRSLAELSENFDVYKGADAVLLMMDMTKSWTFKYVQTELSKIPEHLPVLIIGNHRDQGHHRTVASAQVKSFIDGLKREPSDGIIMYTETSMKDGFGMKLIDKFLNIPFLKLQEDSLMKQLELNRQERLSTNEELQVLQDSIDREYEQYLEMQTIRRRQQADAMSPVNSGLRQLDQSIRENIRNNNFSSDILDKKGPNVTSIESEDLKRSSDPQIPTNFSNDRLASIVIGAKCPLPDLKSIAVNSGVSKSSQLRQDAVLQSEADHVNEEDDSEEEEQPCANPLVTNYQSDLDSDDQAK